MKCIPKRGRQPGLGDKGTCQKGACGAGAGSGGSDPLMDRPEQCGLSAGWEKKPHPYIPVHINAIQQVLLNVCPRIVLPRLSRGGGRKEKPARDALIPLGKERLRDGRGRRTGPGVRSLPGRGAGQPVLALASKGVQAQRGWSQLKGTAGPEGSLFLCEYSPRAKQV